MSPHVSYTSPVSPSPWPAPLPGTSLKCRTRVIPVSPRGSVSPLHAALLPLGGCPLGWDHPFPPPMTHASPREAAHTCDRHVPVCPSCRRSCERSCGGSWAPWGPPSPGTAGACPCSTPPSPRPCACGPPPRWPCPTVPAATPGMPPPSRASGDQCGPVQMAVGWCEPLETSRGHWASVCGAGQLCVVMLRTTPDQYGPV